jgi:signal peptidase I
MLPIDTSFILLLMSILMVMVALWGGFLGYGIDASGEVEPSLISRVVEFCKRWGVVVFAVSIVRVFLWEPFLVPSESMEPGLMPGDYILVDKSAYGFNIPVAGKLFSKSVDRGDIVVFVGPDDDQYIIKRVIGLPGDEISYFRGKLSVNGVGVAADAQESDDNAHLLIREKHQNTVASTKVILTGNGSRIYPGPQGEWNVPIGSYFVMGDHRNRSRDSRMYGVVAEEAIVGKATRIWMSWGGRWPGFDRNGALK